MNSEELSIMNYPLSIMNYELSIVNHQFWILNYELSIMNYQLWIINYELWIISYQKWIINYELWIINYELWIMNCQLWNLRNLRKPSGTFGDLRKPSETFENLRKPLKTFGNDIFGTKSVRYRSPELPIGANESPGLKIEFCKVQALKTVQVHSDPRSFRSHARLGLTRPWPLARRIFVELLGFGILFLIVLLNLNCLTCFSITFFHFKFYC